MSLKPSTRAVLALLREQGVDGRPVYNQYNSPGLPARFWEKVRKTDGCWYWEGAHVRRGYGSIRLSKARTQKTHRYSWELHYGPIPADLHVLHHCDEPACVRPDHLWLGTNADNTADRDAKGRQAKGTAIFHSRLAEDQVREIRRRAIRGNFHALAREYGVDPSSIRRIVSHESWGHVA